MKLHHLGVVAQNLEVALRSLRLDESQIVEEVTDIEQGNNLYFIKFLESNFVLEIVVPLKKTSTVANFASKQKINLHHIAFATDSIDMSTSEHRNIPGHFALKQYKTNVKIFGGEIETSFVFANGLIIEYVENAKK